MRTGGYFSMVDLKVFLETDERRNAMQVPMDKQQALLTRGTLIPSTNTPKRTHPQDHMGPSKWFVVSAQNTLQAFSIYILSQSDATDVDLSTQDTDNVISWNNSSSSFLSLSNSSTIRSASLTWTEQKGFCIRLYELCPSQPMNYTLQSYHQLHQFEIYNRHLHEAHAGEMLKWGNIGTWQHAQISNGEEEMKDRKISRSSQEVLRRWGSNPYILGPERDSRPTPYILGPGGEPGRLCIETLNMPSQQIMLEEAPRSEAPKGWVLHVRAEHEAQGSLLQQEGLETQEGCMVQEGNVEQADEEAGGYHSVHFPKISPVALQLDDVHEVRSQHEEAVNMESTWSCVKISSLNPKA